MENITYLKGGRKYPLLDCYGFLLYMRQDLNLPVMESEILNVEETELDESSYIAMTKVFNSHFEEVNSASECDVVITYFARPSLRHLIRFILVRDGSNFVGLSKNGLSSYVEPDLKDLNLRYMKKVT